MPEATYEYVVIGSGAGGGTVAARLAEYGHTVLLLEAGGDAKQLSGGDPAYPDENRVPDDYDVPCFHPFASENDAMKWDFYVRHYKDPELQKKDKKYVQTPDGPRILYPRAGTLGGCTTHNAQVTIYPHNKDWEHIAEMTGDRSWSPKNMRQYFQRLENCHHRDIWRWLYNLTRINPTRHGFRGWLSTEKAIPEAAIDDEDLAKFIIRMIRDCAGDLEAPLLERLRWQFLSGLGDANDWRLVKDDATGLRYMPLATSNHARTSARERVREVAAKHPDKLHIELDALAARVVLDGNNRATGVEYLKGARLYRASKDPTASGGEPRSVNVSREVILAGGVYNSPQLLMLSGVGPREHLQKLGIACRHDNPAVGTNLQDRYEVGVVNRMNFPEWWLLKGAKFHAGDPQYEEWKTKRRGAYITNGGVVAVIKKSFADRPLPDLFIFALLGNFHGYFPRYSKLFPEGLNYLTWCILKAHTKNSAGTVRLRSRDPRDTPDIDFSYFEEGNDTSGEDLKSVVEAVKFVRKLTEPLRARKLIAEEEIPGDGVRTDAEIADFVKYNAWGHHASCTCPIGSVVDKDFQVLGTTGLRIVDASVFPKIPGFFIVSSIYMIGEKAADVIHQTSKGRA
jgi:choline dehydrogenase-like flavoprotein